MDKTQKKYIMKNASKIKDNSNPVHAKDTWLDLNCT